MVKVFIGGLIYYLIMVGILSLRLWLVPGRWQKLFAFLTWILGAAFLLYSDFYISFRICPFWDPCFKIPPAVY